MSRQKSFDNLIRDLQAYFTARIGEHIPPVQEISLSQDAYNLVNDEFRKLHVYNSEDIKVESILGVRVSKSRRVIFDGKPVDVKLNTCLECVQKDNALNALTRRLVSPPVTLMTKPLEEPGFIIRGEKPKEDVPFVASLICVSLFYFSLGVIIGYMTHRLFP